MKKYLFVFALVFTLSFSVYGNSSHSSCCDIIFVAPFQQLSKKSIYSDEVKIETKFVVKWKDVMNYSYVEIVDESGLETLISYANSRRALPGKDVESKLDDIASKIDDITMLLRFIK